MFNSIDIKSKKLEDYSIQFFTDERSQFFSSLISFFKKGGYESIFIMTDKNVSQLYLENFLNFFKSKKIKVDSFIFEGSEKNKNLKSCQ